MPTKTAKIAELSMFVFKEGCTLPLNLMDRRSIRQNANGATHPIFTWSRCWQAVLVSTQQCHDYENWRAYVSQSTITKLLTPNIPKSSYYMHTIQLERSSVFPIHVNSAYLSMILYPELNVNSYRSILYMPYMLWLYSDWCFKWPCYLSVQSGSFLLFINWNASHYQRLAPRCPSYSYIPS